jgi:hypothetical protein
VGKAFFHCTTSPGQDVVMFSASGPKKEKALNISQGFSLRFLLRQTAVAKN